MEIDTTEALNANSLLPLHLFLDSDGLLHVGGRISNSTGEFPSKHPCIVHKNPNVMKLMTALSREKIC